MPFDSASILPQLCFRLFVDALLVLFCSVFFVIPPLELSPVSFQCPLPLSVLFFFPFSLVLLHQPLALVNCSSLFLVPSFLPPASCLAGPLAVSLAFVLVHFVVPLRPFLCFRLRRISPVNIPASGSSDGGTSCRRFWCSMLRFFLYIPFLLSCFS